MNIMIENFPLLGMGTWGMGGNTERDTKNDKESVAALRCGLDLGITLIDTAEFYGAGHTEELVGEAIKGRPREELTIMTKVWKTNLHYDDVLAAAARSLERLGTDYIDLYLIHWPNTEIPLEETMRAMETLLDQKIIRAIGVSNFSAEQMEGTAKYLTHAQLFADQIEYSLMKRGAEASIIPYAKKHNVRIVAYRPLARGDLTKTNTALLTQLAQKYQKTENQITLNWLIAQGMIAIPKATKPEHIKENSGALGWKLEPDDIELLRKITF